MHSRVLGALRDQVEREIFGELQFTDPRIPVVADQDGAVLHSGDGVRRMLLDGFVRPVHWPQVVAALRELGVGTLYVSGPDSLFGRVGCTTRNFQVVAVSLSTAMQPRRRSAPRPPHGGDLLPQTAP
jgi:[acyl-carrier-protein] S-malonyltransferase